jgi:hypothetical protein
MTERDSQAPDRSEPSTAVADAGGPDAVTPAGGRRRIGTPSVIVLVTLAGLAVSAVAMAAAGGQRRNLGPDLACADVAQAVGLDFRGDRGPVFPAMDAWGKVMQENMGNGAAVGDYDGDGYLDVLLLGQAGHRTRLFHNDPAPDGGRRFADATDASGLGTVTSNARVAQFVDLSGSGRPDIVITADHMPGGPGGPSRIFRNDGGGHFTDVTAGSGFDPTGYIVGGMTFADYDGSGHQSIWLSYWTDEAAADPGRTEIKGLFPGHNRLYRNLGGFRFQDVTDSMGVEPYHADSFTAVFADFTGDGLPDIYQANDNRPDRFYQNLGGGRFRDPGYRDGLTRVGNSMGVAPRIGRAGDLQLYVTHITDPSGLFGSNVGNTLMVNEQAPDGITFRNVISSYGIADTAWGWGAAFVDMDLDGALDLYAVQGMHAYVGTASDHLANATSTLFLDDGTGDHYTVAKSTGCDVAGDQRALVVFDYDRDGSPDLLITQVDGPTMLLRNHTRGKHWLTVAPTGQGDAAIDARVSVTTGGRTTTQLLLAGGSFLAGPPREAYFGLAAAATADLVRVDWADGSTSELRDVPADQVLRLPHR